MGNKKRSKDRLKSQKPLPKIHSSQNFYFQTIHREMMNGGLLAIEIHFGVLCTFFEYRPLLISRAMLNIGLDMVSNFDFSSSTKK